ncbi:MAG: class I SAM-dependent methyltransferase [Gammaproteobacteria bacterium]
MSGRVLEVGSKNYGNTASFRDQYGNCEYIGVDIAQGEGVDQVIDLCEGTGVLALNSFDLIICCSVLEHVKKPWLMAANLSQLLGIGGLIYISVPWVWRYHPYPDDYFRFSWRGVQELFDGFQWRDITYSTNIPGEFHPIDNAANRIDSALGFRKRVWFRGRRKYLPSLMVNMLGTKVASDRLEQAG